MKFKTITYKGFFIDPYMLYKGCYQSGVPSLYDKNMNKEIFFNLMKRFYTTYGMGFLGDFEDFLQKLKANIDLCEFIDIELKK